MQRAEDLHAQLVAHRTVLESHADQQTGPGEAFDEGGDSEQAPGGREGTGHAGTPVRDAGCDGGCGARWLSNSNGPICS